MSHFKALCAILQNAHRNLSANEAKKLAGLSHRAFQQAKKEFAMPLNRIIQMSKQRPVRLILDYVLIGRTCKFITFPFNLTFNPNTQQLQPTLFLLFALAEVEGELYPIEIDFWANEDWEPEDGLYLSKNDVAKSMITGLVEKGLEFYEVLFDAGFPSEDLLNELDDLEIPYICRIKSNWQISAYGLKRSAKEMFSKKRRFFFDRHLNCFLFSRKGHFGSHEVKLVAVANTRQKLLKRQFYCLLTNRTELKHTQVLRHYQKRGKIEWFFKVMKSYLGLAAFFRHHPDESLLPHFHFRCSAFVVLQSYAKSLSLSFFKALQKLKKMSWNEAQKVLEPHWCKWSESLMFSTRDKPETCQTLVGTT